MGATRLSQLYRAVAESEPPLLRPFVSASFAQLLRECPGLARGLFGELLPLSAPVPTVLTNVPGHADTPLDIVLKGDGGSHLLIENRLAPDVDWYEERTPQRPIAHTDAYISAARHRYDGRAMVLVLTRAIGDVPARRYPPEVYAGTRTWASIHAQLEAVPAEDGTVPFYLIHEFLELLKEHDMNPSEPIVPAHADVIMAFDQFARNSLKLLDDAVGRIRQEFELKAIPNNRRLAGWYACSDRFQSDDLHFFFYLMFPPVPDLVLRPAVQVTKESTSRGLAAAAEHGFRRGRWGSLWIERDFRREHPFVSLSAARQVEEIVRFFQNPLSRLAKAGLIQIAPARHGEPAAASDPGAAVRSRPRRPGAQARASLGERAEGHAPPAPPSALPAERSAGDPPPPSRPEETTAAAEIPPDSVPLPDGSETDPTIDTHSASAPDGDFEAPTDPTHGA